MQLLRRRHGGRVLPDVRGREGGVPPKRLEARSVRGAGGESSLLLPLVAHLLWYVAVLVFVAAGCSLLPSRPLMRVNPTHPAPLASTGTTPLSVRSRPPVTRVLAPLDLSAVPLFVAAYYLKKQILYSFGRTSAPA